jgi:hypothetical protein
MERFAVICGDAVILSFHNSCSGARTGVALAASPSAARQLVTGRQIVSPASTGSPLRSGLGRSHGLPAPMDQSGAFLETKDCVWVTQSRAAVTLVVRLRRQNCIGCRIRADTSNAVFIPQWQYICALNSLSVVICPFCNITACRATVKGPIHSKRVIEKLHSECRKPLRQDFHSRLRQPNPPPGDPSTRRRDRRRRQPSLPLSSRHFRLPAPNPTSPGLTHVPKPPSLQSSGNFAGWRT